MAAAAGGPGGAGAGAGGEVEVGTLDGPPSVTWLGNWMGAPVETTRDRRERSVVVAHRGAVYLVSQLVTMPLAPGDYGLRVGCGVWRLARAPDQEAGNARMDPMWPPATWEAAPAPAPLDVDEMVVWEAVASLDMWELNWVTSCDHSLSDGIHVRGAYAVRELLCVQVSASTPHASAYRQPSSWLLGLNLLTGKWEVVHGEHGSMVTDFKAICMELRSDLFLSQPNN